jgi:hypothetical protein
VARIAAGAIGVVAILLALLAGKGFNIQFLDRSFDELRVRSETGLGADAVPRTA